ncbi:MAG: polyhydroxyalkanoate biosynthesis repressor PhaR [Omnitrophica WOR_2 bacterium RIFCSPLOWO2_02_FULL_50_19]|nr:MAG: polyhydroxyalkanoate biosynthesis repressor PhaR [Omnitrophica WOR_2 bacterium RIFCSPLOWO2_02_FULL_50_19]
MREFAISGRRIGPGNPPFIIAEVGINHEGEYSKAVRLVDAAVRAGADCVKFQCHITDKEMIYTDMKPGKISKERLWDIIKRCELTESEEKKIRKYCREKKIMYLSTPFSREAADRLDKAGVPAFKIGSGECNNLPLLEHIARKGKPVILSTGMNDIKSIRVSVNLLRKYKIPLMLMHCVSMYPTPYNNVRLPAISQLREEFNLPVGLSDHSSGIYICLGAVALGAVALEKHFTIKRSWPGPDNPISIEPGELRDLVKGSRAVWEAMKGRKEIQPKERPVIDFAYASVVTISPVGKGEFFSLKNIWVKRPGTGDFLAKDFDRLLKKKANRDLPAGVQVKREDVK